MLIDYVHGMLCLDDAKVMQPEVKGKHIALVTPPHSDSGVLSTEPLIIPVYLSGVPGRPLLLLLDSGISNPLLYDVGKTLQVDSPQMRQYAITVQMELNECFPSSRLRRWKSADLPFIK